MDFDFDNLVVTQQKKEYEKINPGLHNAICVGIWNVGKQKIEFNGEVKYKQQVIFGFEVEQRNSETNEQMLHLEKYNMSLHEKSRLAPLIESWTNQKLKDNERYNFDLSNFVGKKATLNLIENGNYTNISAILAAQDTNKMKMEDVLKGEVPNFVKTMRAKAVINDSDQETKVNINDIKPVEKDTQSLQKTKLDQKAPF